MVSFRPMQTSLNRRQRRRQAARRRPRGTGAVKYVALAIPLVLFATLFMLGAAGATFAVAGYSFLAKDLPDPQKALEAIEYDQQSTVYDRSGKVLLAKLGTDRRELVAYEDVPPELLDATTAIEDKTFWENSGFDPLAFVSAAIDTLQGNDRGGSTITQQLVRNRLLPADVIAPDADIYQRKLKEIIQSIRLTEAYPGDPGKQAIITAYLNNNYYGNRSYGVAAAAQTYWKKDLKDLTLAQWAILAGIPKSPTNYDLVLNSVEETYTDDDGKEQSRLVVPPESPVVLRRNQILEFMKTRLEKTPAGRYSAADFEAAKAEPVILAEQGTERWRAPHFVWQVREELSQLICGETQCEKIDSGGYQVFTTLDYRMQRIVEKWAYAAAIIPNAKNPQALLKARGIPRSQWSWILGLRGHNIHNDAAGVMDYRTGEVLAYAGSASYTGKGNKKFQPQFDVLASGWRQPGSSIKPLVYLVGIDDKTMTAATMFMDVVTNFAGAGAKPYTPKQADGLERGPVRLRNALQFSLNVPAIKAGFLNGLEHQFDRTKDFGLSYPPSEVPVASQSIGTLVTHPIDMIGAYGMIANGGVLMPRHTILKVVDADGKQVWPEEGVEPKGERVVSRQAAYIITDILAGNTIDSINPFWGKWNVTDGLGGRYRPAAYKTGTTNDNKDVHAYGYLAPPENKDLPALVAGVWMGNSDSTPNDGKLSLDTSAPLWSAILSEVSKGYPIDKFSRVKPKGLVTATVDAFTGMRASASSKRTVEELFIPGTEPEKTADIFRKADVDQASGLLWREGCVGPMVSKTFVDFSKVEAGFKSWQKADIGWQQRAARGPGVAGGPERTRTAYFYGGGFYPFGRSWGGAFVPTKKCPIGPPPPSICVSTDPLSPCPSLPPESPAPTPQPGNGGAGGGKPTQKP
jgi:membrane peptidoglycan carboxypeptidase